MSCAAEECLFWVKKFENLKIEENEALPLNVCLSVYKDATSLGSEQTPTGEG